MPPMARQGLLHEGKKMSIGLGAAVAVAGAVGVIYGYTYEGAFGICAGMVIILIAGFRRGKE